MVYSFIKTRLTLIGKETREHYPLSGCDHSGYDGFLSLSGCGGNGYDVLLTVIRQLQTVSGNPVSVNDQCFIR